MKKGIKSVVIWAAVIMFILLLVLNLSYNSGKEISYSELITDMSSGSIKKLVIDSDHESVTAYYTEESDNTDVENIKIATIPNDEAFMEIISQKMFEGTLNIDIVQKQSSEYLDLFATFLPIVIMLIFALVFMFMMMGANQNGGKSSMSFGKSKARMVNGTEAKSQVTFKDVAGIDEEKEELAEIVDFLKSPKKYTDMGARIPKGVLLVGHPGTGKTLLAKAVAGEAGVPFFFISGSDFVEMFVGVGASRVRDLFDQAKKNAPCIVFIDEIDAVGRQRGAGLGGGHDEREQTLNQLLVEMDGFTANEGVIVLAATNRPDILDKALLRAGRFDRQIVVSPPDVKAREQILRVHARRKRIADDVDFGTIAQNTAGFVGADLENILNEAALLAARKNKMEIGMDEVEEAMVKVTMGPEKKSRVISDKEKKLVAFHEGGHAVASHFLPTQDAVHEISIIPRGMAGGYTMYRPSEDKSFTSKSEMEEQIISLLGGRVAEQLVLGDVSTGASNDIERATKIARSMVTKYGMSEKLGAIMYGNGQEEVFLGRDITQGRNFSEETSSVIDQEVKRIIDTAYKKTIDILNENMEKLHKVAAVLMDKEKITGEEFDSIMNS